MSDHVDGPCLHSRNTVMLLTLSFCLRDTAPGGPNMTRPCIAAVAPAGMWSVHVSHQGLGSGPAEGAQAIDAGCIWVRGTLCGGEARPLADVALATAMFCGWQRVSSCMLSRRQPAVCRGHQSAVATLFGASILNMVCQSTQWYKLHQSVGGRVNRQVTCSCPSVASGV